MQTYPGSEVSMVVFLHLSFLCLHATCADRYWASSAFSHAGCHYYSNDAVAQHCVGSFANVLELLGLERLPWEISPAHPQVPWGTHLLSLPIHHIRSHYSCQIGPNDSLKGQDFLKMPHHLVKYKSGIKVVGEEEVIINLRINSFSPQRDSDNALLKHRHQADRSE